MPLLQDPLRTARQIQWFLDSREHEVFPGAFVLAAGNLSRQLLEQVLFILAFYSGMPHTRFLKSTTELRSVDGMIKALRERNPTTGERYVSIAASRGSRIKKFAKLARSFDRWRRLFNEPSHFGNPKLARRTNDEDIRRFAGTMTHLLEEVDGFLIVAAVNEIRSRGHIRAVLGAEPKNLPGVEAPIIITPEMIDYREGRFSMLTSEAKIEVLSNSREVPLRWSKHVVVIERSHGMELRYRLITRAGKAVNMSNFQSVINTFANDDRDRPRLIRRMRALGLKVTVERRTA